MYHELKKLIKGKWWTQTSAKTGANGKAGFRGFLGDYKITATAKNGKIASTSFTLAKGDNNRTTVTLP